MASNSALGRHVLESNPKPRSVSFKSWLSGDSVLTMCLCYPEGRCLCYTMTVIVLLKKIGDLDWPKAVFVFLLGISVVVLTFNYKYCK